MDSERVLAYPLREAMGGPENQLYLSPAYINLLSYLFPAHPDAFFERVLFLLGSPVLAEREAGARLLRNTMHTTFGFEASEFTEQRRQRLPSVREELKRLTAAHDEVKVRHLLLGREGVHLKGGIGSAWLPALAQAIHKNPDNEAVVANALLLSERITTGNPFMLRHDASHGILELLSLPAAERDRDVTALLKDFRAK